MHSQAHDNKHKSDDKGRAIDKDSPNHASILPTVSANRRLSTKSLLSPEIKRYDPLCPTILEHCESLLQIQPIRRALKSVNSTTNDDQPSVITINVSGTRFQTYLSTLKLYPNTLLGDERRRKRYWNSVTQEYFFDRHRACFESILYYYQSHGRLRRPEFVPIDTFLEEISFFQLGSEAINQIHQTENIKVLQQIPMPGFIWRRYIWFYFEYPQHSSLARFIHLLSLFLTILSCVSLAIESLPIYINRSENICKEQANIPLNSTSFPHCSAMFTSPFFIIQTICVAYFTIEFLLRLISTPSYWRFFLSFFNWVDIASIVPYFIILGLQLSNQDTRSIHSLRVLRFARIFKIHLVFGKLKTLKVLTATIQESLLDFAVMIIILTLTAFLFGAAMFFAEQDIKNGLFNSIPVATYWGIITITGVGYGDMVPQSTTGRIITCLCAFVGAGMMGMFVSVLVDRYQRVYNRKMYTPKPEISTAELERRLSDPSYSKLSFSSRKSGRKLSGISGRLSTLSRRLKYDRPESSSQSYKVEFIVSFDDESINDYQADNIISTMQEKVAEAASNSDCEIQLKSIENTSNKI